MSLAEFEALEVRRRVEVRHARFNAALVASILVNAHRADDSEPVSPFDFLPGFQRDDEQMEKDRLRRSTKKAVAAALGQMTGKTVDELRTIKDGMVERMRKQGIEDPEEIVREVYPEL
jgi:hypothetical protein